MGEDRGAWVVSGRVSHLSVVVVNFNSGAFLEATTTALLASLPPGSELIVVDNDSSDSSAAPLRDHDGIIFVQLERNVGFGAAANIGAARARNELIVFLNPDAFVPDGTLQRMAGYLAAHAESALCGALLLDFQGREQAGSRRYDPTLLRSWGKAVRSIVPTHIFPTFDRHDEPLPSMPVQVDAISGACMMVRRQVHQNIGGFDEGFFLHFEDLDYCRRARDAGWDVGFVPDAPVFHYQGASGLVTADRLLQHKHAGLARYLDKFGSEGKVSRAIRTLALAALKLAVGIAPWGFRLKNIRSRRSATLVNDNELIKVGQMLSGTLPVVMLFGARSDLGDAFNARLSACGQNTVNVSRNPAGVRAPPGSITVHPDMLVRNRVGARLNVAGLVSVCPIWELPGYADFLTNPSSRKAPWVILSSTSAVTKQESAERASQAVVSKLCAGEDGVVRMRSDAASWTTIVRPTLIYGGRRNRNINKIRQITTILRIKINIDFARGSRQPIHCDDIAEWAISLLLLGSVNQKEAIQDADQQARKHGTIISTRPIRVDVAGGEAVSFAEMVNRTQATACAGGIRLYCRRGVAKLLFSVAHWLPWFREVPGDFVSRLEQDFLFSSEEAIALQSQVFRRFYP